MAYDLAGSPQAAASSALGPLAGAGIGPRQGALEFVLMFAAATLAYRLMWSPMLVDDAALKDARIALAFAVRQVIRNGLGLLGVSCPQSM